MISSKKPTQIILRIYNIVSVHVKFNLTPYQTLVLINNSNGTVIDIAHGDGIGVGINDFFLKGGGDGAAHTGIHHHRKGKG